MNFYVGYAAFALVFGAMNVSADVRLPAIFGDHMVLQQEGKIPLWGTADPGEKVTVRLGKSLVAKADVNPGPDKTVIFGHEYATAIAGADGKWRVNLAPMRTSVTGLTLTVTGKNTVTFQDVLVGEVWLASGQSNMELTMNPGLVQGKETIAQANNPQIRLFVVQRTPDLMPQDDLKGSWKLCTPDTVGGFSAVAYFFGRDLQKKLHRPVGLIESDWGGTAIESWTSIEALKTLPFTQAGVDNAQKRKDSEPKGAEDRATAQADFEAKLKDWRTGIDIPYQAEIKQWQAACAAAKAAGQPEPPRPNELSPPPKSSLGDAFEFTTLFNGMIAPIIPYAMRGVIWYQGESNAGFDGATYGMLLKTMIGDWRSRWNEGDFPFLVVGLANFQGRYPYPVDSGWAGVRFGQAQVTGTVPNTALAEAIDIGEAQNVHPLDKLDVGKRLAAAALALAYKQTVSYQGPRFSGMKIEGDKLRITFKDTDGGLMIGQPPYVPPDNPAPPTDKLVGFAIAGADKKWVFADAKIEGRDVVLSSPQVSNPVAARYGWASNPQVNLYNRAAFPAVPFRTDDWPYVPPPPNPNP